MTFGRPKKSLGQNFLIQPNIVAKIVHSANIVTGEKVLEVGPGRGVLTRALLDAGAQVTAVEKDDVLFIGLHETFAEDIRNKTLSLIPGDILEKNLEDIGLENHRFSIVANIPYYITGELLRRMLSGTVQPKHMTLMVQKEVALRICGSQNRRGSTSSVNESLLSLSVKAYGAPKYVGTVGKGNFYPVPKVDSAILNIEYISKKFFDELTVGNLWKKQGTTGEEVFFKVLRAGFAHKRKYVIGNLSELVPKESLVSTFKACNIAEKSRAEELSLANWKSLLSSSF